MPKKKVKTRKSRTVIQEVVKYKNGRPDYFFEQVEETFKKVALNGYPGMVEVETSMGLMIVTICKSRLAPRIKITQSAPVETPNPEPSNQCGAV